MTGMGLDDSGVTTRPAPWKETFDFFNLIVEDDFSEDCGLNELPPRSHPGSIFMTSGR